MGKRQTYVYYKSNRISTVIETETGNFIGNIKVPVRLPKLKKPKLKNLFEQTDREINLLKAKMKSFIENLRINK